MEIKGNLVNKSIAVLPFVNMSADPDNEYFSDGITEEIINALTKIQGLKVIARTSSFAFKGRNVDVRTIGTQLGVTTVLEGSVRKANKRVRITAQLVRTDDGSHLWSKKIDRGMEDIFALQDEISLLIADKIRENFGHLTISDHLIDAPTDDLEAYNLYLKGRYFHLKWAEIPMQKAIQYYKASIEKDPSFALPYFGIGYCFTLIGAWGGRRELLDIAASYLDKGMAIDKESFLGHFALGALKYWGYWDYEGGAKLYQKAIQINPHFTEGHDGMAEILINVGQFDEALQYVDRSLELSPFSANHFYTKGAIYFYAKNYHESLRWMKESLRIDPSFPHPLIKIPLCYILLGQENELNTFLDGAVNTQDSKILRQIQKLYSEKAVKEEDILALLNKEGHPDKISLWVWTLYLLSLSGKTEEAFVQLKEAVAMRVGIYANFRHFPFIDNLRKLSGFEQLTMLPTQFNSLIISDNEEVDRPKDKFFASAEVADYLKQLEKLMLEQRPYVESSLNLRVLAEILDLHPNKLSWLINEHIGKNFNEYVNAYRLENFKEKALDPRNSHLTLLGLAYESGFNSKTVFNAFFKKTEGMTPRTWVKLNKSGSKLI